MITQIDYEYLLKRFEDLLSSVNNLELLAEKAKLEIAGEDPEFWSNPANTEQLRKLARLEKEEEEIVELKEVLANLSAAFELRDEESFVGYHANAEKLSEKLEKRLFFKGDFDDRAAVLSVHAGAGGVDAADFAAMIMSMYQAFCKNQEWKYTITSLSSGESGGVKSAEMIVTGEFAYGFLRAEAGVHRLIRLSPFNSGNTRETSFVSVEVLPEGLDEVTDIHINDKDLRVDTFLSSGNGGQSVNTTYSAVRITHIPTGITAQSQNERDQIQNREIALKILRARLAHKRLMEQKDLLQSLRGITSSAEFGSQIRTYTLHPYKLVKDHRTGYETSDVDSVLDGKAVIDFIWAEKKREAAIQTDL